MDGDGIAEANGLSIAHADLNHSQVETVAMHLSIIVTTVCEERHAGLFEPRQIRGVVHDTHRIGLGKAHA